MLLGAAAGIVGASAAPTSKQAAPRPAFPRGGGPWRGFGPGRVGAPLGPAVHADVVVLNRAGTKFITATEDSGTVQSVSGDQLTIKEAVGKVTYRTATLTIPSSATITRNFAKAALSALKAGDRARIVQSSDGTEVDAIDPSSLPVGPRSWKPGAPVHPGFIPGGPMRGPRGGGQASPPPLPQGGAASASPAPPSGA